MNTERRYAFEAGNSFNMAIARELVESYGYHWQEDMGLVGYAVDVVGPPGADLEKLDSKLLELGATLLTGSSK